MILKLEIEVDSKIEAYKIVNHLSFEEDCIVLEADFEGERYEFGDEEDEKPKRFLSDRFNKNKINKTL